MTKYESDVRHVNAPVELVYAKLSNLENLRPLIDGAANNEALRAHIEASGYDASSLEALKDVKLTADSVSIPAPMVGEISLCICEREENRCVKFETTQSPIQANMWIQVLPVSAEEAKMRVTLKADLNPMIKMMVGSKLKDGVQKFADMLAMIPYTAI